MIAVMLMTLNIFLMENFSSVISVRKKAIFYGNHKLFIIINKKFCFCVVFYNYLFLVFSLYFLYNNHHHNNKKQKNRKNPLLYFINLKIYIYCKCIN